MSHPDLHFSFHGSIVTCQPLTPEGQEWIDEHVSEEATWFGSSLCIEPRYLDAFVTGAQNDGITCGADE